MLLLQWIDRSPTYPKHYERNEKVEEEDTKTVLNALANIEGQREEKTV